jgi:hypothetical protein
VLPCVDHDLPMLFSQFLRQRGEFYELGASPHN